MNHFGVHVNFVAILCCVHFDKHQKKLSSLLKFTFAAIKSLTRKSYISAKIEAEKHLHAVFSANCGAAPTSNQIVEGLFSKYIKNVNTQR